MLLTCVLFLAWVQYYAKFLPDLATHLAPLHRLLQKDVTWLWGAAEQTSFLVVKEMLLQDRVLMRYDPDSPLVLATDSSSYGLGAVLSHRTAEGVERPIAYASRVPVRNREEVRTNRERSIIFGLGCEEVPNVPGGSPLHLGHRPSAFEVHNGPREGCASHSSSEDSTLVSLPRSFFIQYRVPRYQATCQL